MSAARKQLALRNNGNTTRARVKSTRWHAAFLKALRRNPNVAMACRAAGVNRTTAYRHRDDNEAFAVGWRAALDESVDLVEATAFKLASEGEPRLIEFILKAHRPSVYRDVQRMEIDARACGVLLLPEKEDLPP
jgi:hypothetical protein